MSHPVKNVGVYICIYRDVYTSMHIHMYVILYIYIYTHTYIMSCVYIYIYTDRSMHTLSLCAHYGIVSAASGIFKA